MIWEYCGLVILVDPIAGEQLDFGVPALYRATRKVLDRTRLLELMTARRPDAILVTQGLADHLDVPTIKELLGRWPGVRIICPPSAAAALAGVAASLAVLRPGERTQLLCEDGGGAHVRVDVLATEGSLVGPPWQSRENGYIVSSPRGGAPAVYYEPHGDVDPAALHQAGLRADVVVAPAVEQGLPGFTLVHGALRSLDVACALGAKVIVPLDNGDLVQAGPAASLISAGGSIDELRVLVEKRSPDIEVAVTLPGVPITVAVPVPVAA